MAAQWAIMLVLTAVTGSASAATGHWPAPKTALENGCGAFNEMGLKKQVPAHPHNLPQAQQSEQLQENGEEDDKSHSSALPPAPTLTNPPRVTFLFSTAAIAVGGHSVNIPKLFILHHSLVI